MFHFPDSFMGFAVGNPSIIGKFAIGIDFSERVDPDWNRFADRKPLFNVLILSHLHRFVKYIGKLFGRTECRDSAFVIINANIDTPIFSAPAPLLVNVFAKESLKPIEEPSFLLLIA